MLAADPWLQRWLPLIAQRAGGAPVLEIGCGAGEDSLTLVSAGLQLIAFDLSEQAIAAARLRVPSAQFERLDVRAPWPVGASATHVVVASLSLHYFPWVETESLVERVHQVLRPQGLLLCRLNSIKDHHYGAIGHPQIDPHYDPHYFLVDGEPKRFFDRPDIDRLFRTGWKILSVEEQTTHKYAMPKTLGEIVLEKETGATALP